MTDLELAGIAARLYALPFEDFVAARNAAAKEITASAAGRGPAAKEHRALADGVRSLPKPSVAAWTVNMLAAHRPEPLTELAVLGQAMRAAQTSLDAADLRRLSRQRRQLLASAVRDARAVAAQHGRKISGAVAAEVEETLRAATADEGAAAAAQSGRLLRGLTADGVEVVELAGAVALASAAVPAVATPQGKSAPVRADRSTAADHPARGTGPAAKEAPEALTQQRQPRLHAVRDSPRTATTSMLERARAAHAEAEEDAGGAAQEALLYGRQLDEVTARASELADAARSLRQELEQTELDLRSARARQDLVAARAKQAIRAADRARRKADLARERVLRLGNTPG